MTLSPPEDPVIIEVTTDLVLATLVPDQTLVEIIVATPTPIAQVVTPTDYVDLVTGLRGAVGPAGPVGPPGGTTITGWWDYAFQTSPPPAVGDIRTTPDPIVVGQPMTIYLSATDDSGLVWDGSNLRVGDQVRLRGTAGAVLYATITAFAITAPGPTGYATLTTTVTSLTSQIAKNAKVEVTLIRPPASGPTGPTGPQGVVLLESGQTTPPAGTPVGTVIYRKV